MENETSLQNISPIEAASSEQEKEPISNQIDPDCTLESVITPEAIHLEEEPSDLPIEVNAPSGIKPNRRQRQKARRRATKSQTEVKVAGK